MEDWDKDKEYDRVGLEYNYTEYLGKKVVCHNLPVRPGRNLAIVVESAAVNFRQKKMGYNAAEELRNRIQQKMANKLDDDEILVLSLVRLFVTPWTIAHQAPLFIIFPRQEPWRGLPFPSPGGLPDPGSKPSPVQSAALEGGFFTTSTPWEAQTN